MNPNPYPKGRWSTPVASVLPAVVRAPVSNPAPALGTARLTELFWGCPEGELLAEAAQRIDEVLLRAAAVEPGNTTPDCAPVAP